MSPLSYYDLHIQDESSSGAKDTPFLNGAVNTGFMYLTPHPLLVQLYQAILLRDMLSIGRDQVRTPYCWRFGDLTEEDGSLMFELQINTNILLDAIPRRSIYLRRHPASQKLYTDLAPLGHVNQFEVESLGEIFRGIEFTFDNLPEETKGMINAFELSRTNAGVPPPLKVNVLDRTIFRVHHVNLVAPT